MLPNVRLIFVEAWNMGQQPPAHRQDASMVVCRNGTNATWVIKVLVSRWMQNTRASLAHALLLHSSIFKGTGPDLRLLVTSQNAP